MTGVEDVSCIGRSAQLNAGWAMNHHSTAKRRTYSFPQVPRARSEAQQPAADRNRHSMRAIVRAKLLDEVLDVEVDGVLRDRQLIGYLLVFVPVANQLQDLDLSRGERLLAQMFGKHGGHLEGHTPLAGMDGTNHGEQFVLRHALEHVTER